MNVRTWLRVGMVWCQNWNEERGLGVGKGTQGEGFIWRQRKWGK